MNNSLAAQISNQIMVVKKAPSRNDFDNNKAQSSPSADFVDMVDLNSESPLTRFAGRNPAGSDHTVTLSKNGVRHIRRDPGGEEKEILSVGLACSECFSGPRLARILLAGHELERQAIEAMLLNNHAPTLSIHTSSGVPEALGDFIHALEPHLPWKNAESLDWCVSLQMEGASAVWAGIDMLLQQQILETGNKFRKMVAVGATSYHGPPSTSFGSKCPLWHKNYQVMYPVPKPGAPIDESMLLMEFDNFLRKHGDDIGVLLIEPQWGSSQAAFPWPKTLLQGYVSRAKAHGIKILADEIMCGLGRHGHGTMFISEAWDLDPDVVTFGKAIGGGVFPLSGAILKNGRNQLGSDGRSVMQSHTYAGSSVRALMTAVGVLNELPKWFASIAKLGEEMEHIMGYIARISRGMIISHGQGLMWGAMLSHDGQNRDEIYRSETVECFRKNCEDAGVLPYFVPVGGIMVTPVVDIDVGTVYEIGQRLEQALLKTMSERNWKGVQKSNVVPVVPLVKNSACSAQLHDARSCTSCTRFVCPDVRMRFVHYD